MYSKKSAVYNYVAENYTGMSKDQLKDILLEALSLIDDESELVDILNDSEIVEITYDTRVKTNRYKIVNR
jgi:hypothetical protein